MSELIGGGNGQLIHILERQSCTKSWEKNAFYSTTREGTTETTWYYGDYISSHMISCHPQWSWWNQFSMCFDICHGAAIATYQKNFNRVCSAIDQGTTETTQFFVTSIPAYFRISQNHDKDLSWKKMFIQVIPSYYSLEKSTKGIPNWTGRPVIEK